MSASAAGQETLVFLHGSGDTAACWDGVVARLGAEHRAVHCLDLPGHGSRATESMAGLDDVPAFARAVLAEADRLGIGPATYIGHSLGSAIALQLALDTPERVRRLVLIGGGARLRVLPELLPQARDDPDAALRRVSVLGHAPDHAAMAAAYAEQPKPRAAEALYRDLCACDGFDVGARLGEVRQPALVLVGEQDRLTPPKYASFLADRIPNSTLVVIAGAGHYVMHEAPDAVAGALRSWLDE